MRNTSLILLSGAMVLLLISPRAEAIEPFKKAFAEKYVAPANDPDFTKLVKTTGCFVCHVKGQNRKARNAYGEALAKLIEGNAKARMDAAEMAGTEAAEKEKLLKELEAAFTKAEAEKSPSGPTYGKLLKQHKLPQ